MKSRQTCITMILVLAALAPACDRPPVENTVAAAGRTGDAALRERDVLLLREVDALNARCGARWQDDAECVEQACRLRARELDLFAEVRAHDFSSITESNYWHRGRLKFPGDLEQLLLRLSGEPRWRSGACAAFGPAREPSPRER